MQELITLSEKKKKKTDWVFSMWNLRNLKKKLILDKT